MNPCPVDPRRVVGSQLATGYLVGLSRPEERLRDPIGKRFHAIGLADVSGHVSQPRPPHAAAPSDLSTAPQPHARTRRSPA